MASLSPAAIASPQLLYQGSPGFANPVAALSLSTDTATTSSLTATTYYVQYDVTGWTGRTTTGSSQSSIAVGTAGNDILTSVTLTTGMTGVGVYVGTASNPVLLGTIAVSESGSTWSVGTITYSGSTTAGLSATVSGSTLSITISAAANGGTSSQQFTDATTVLYTAPAQTTAVPSPVATATLTSLVAINGDSNSHKLSLWIVPSTYIGGSAGNTTPGPDYALLFQSPIQAGDMITDAPMGIQIPAQTLIIGASDGALTTTLPNGSKALPIGLYLSGVVTQ